MSKSYVVTGLCAIVNVEHNSAVVTVMKDAPVPSNATEASIQHLLRRGLIAEAVHSGGLAPLVTGDGQTVLTHPGVDPDAAPGTDGGLAGPARYPVEGAEAEQDAWVKGNTIEAVLAEVSARPEVNGSVIAAEQRRGDAARSTLLAKLTGGS